MRYYIEEEMKALRERFEEIVLGWPDVTSRKMFGCPSYLAKGTVFGILVTKGLVLTRLSEKDRRELSNTHETTPFEANRRVIKSWIRIPVSDPEDIKELLPFVRKSHEAALSKE
jgi:TfoX/Sxy family transcriptional regulator of competence genes